MAKPSPSGAHRYQDALPDELQADALTSKDADFCGDKKAVRLAAKLLDGQLTEPDHGEQSTPTIGIIKFVDDAGENQWIDFIDQPYGVKKADLEKSAQELVLLDPHGADTDQRFLTMHPLHVLQSRVANTVHLPDYRTPLALRQLRAAVSCCREYALRDVLDVDDYAMKHRQRAVLKQNEAVARLAGSRDGLQVFKEHKIDLLNAMLDDARLPAAFRNTRLPQLLQSVRAAQQRGG